MPSANLVIVAFALLATACGAKAMGPPEIVVDRTACSHCGMFVSEPVYGAAYQTEHAEARVFDDIGCMLEALLTETASPAGVWVQDAAGKGWLDAEKATFVATQSIRTPMSGGVLAYTDVAAAEQAAAAHHGEVVRSFEELRTRKGGAR
jgi:nitrous oxide reductase accessory protein NosL